MVIGGHKYKKGEHRLLPRSECSDLTKRFAAEIDLQQLSTVLGAVPDPSDYLSLLEAWIGYNSTAVTGAQHANFTA